MTAIQNIPVNDRRERFTASGGQTVFSFDFPVYAATDLQVTRLRAGAETVLVNGVDYSVTGAGTQEGGTITLTVGAAAGDLMTIASNQPHARSLALYNGGDLTAQVLEAEFNRQVISLQQLAAQYARALKQPESDTTALVLPPAAARALRFMGFDELGNVALAALTTTSVPLVSGWLDVKAAGYVKADGVTDDTLGWRAAAATGLPLYYSGGNTIITGKIDITATGQRVLGHKERSVITAVGSFDTFAFSGNVKGQGMAGITWSSAGKTGGSDILVANGCWRGHFDDMEFVAPWTAMDIRGRNETTLGRLIIQGYRGPRGLLWLGSTAEPSGILRIQSLVGAPAAGNNGVGMEINGACTSLVADELEWNAPPGATNEMQHGIWAHNAIGAPHGMLFFFADKAQVDFPYSDGFRFDVGIAYSLVNLYAQGSKIGSGIYCGTAVQDVTIANPFIKGNQQHGVYFAGIDLEITGGAILNNSWPAAAPVAGTYNGVHIAGTAKRVSVVGVRIGNAEGAGATHRYGVYGAPGATNITISGCNLFGNLLDPVRDDTGGVIGNFDALGNAAVNYSLDGATLIGSETGYRGKLTPTITGGQVTAVTVADAGYHYDLAPSVFFFDPAGTGSGATATANVANGKITSITVTAPGAGYGANTIAYVRSFQGPVALRAMNPAVADQTIAIRAQGGGAQVQLGNERGVALSVQAVDPATVNGLTVRGFAAGVSPDIIASGADANINIGLFPKGTGRLVLGGTTAGAAGAVAAYLNVIVGGNSYKLPLYNP